ncbi:MAG TPA: Uma2 family endonuclease [Beijerinckiaceae bacterium]|jgi:Uma2 family endonuclease
MAEPAAKHATYADLEAVPPHLVAELIHGSLVTHPRPSPRHGSAAINLSAEVVGAFERGRGGPGGWVFMTEPELRFGQNILVPDIAGWRRERLPALPDTNWIETPPDWVCEILSPSTEVHDRGAKREIYAAAGVAHLWLLNPVAQQLEAFVLTAGKWLLAAVVTGAEEVAAPPFEAAPFSLGLLWPFDPPNEPESGLQT